MKQAGKYLSLAAVLLLLLGGGVFLWQSGFFTAASSQESMQAYIQRFAPYSHLCFFLVQFLSVVLAPIPSNITALVGGVMFGTWLSFFLTFAAVLLGSLLVFVLARNLGQSFVNRVVGERVSAKYLDVIHAKTDVFLVLAFLFPFFPDDLLCILAGLTDLSLKRFLILCLVARPWGLLVACGVGGSALSIPPWAMVLMGLVGLAVFLVAMRYGDKVEQAILQRMNKD